MNNPVKVSIITPVYNVEKYLRQCLDSVINQTLKDIELICIDDGSSDNSSRILDQYAAKDSRIKVIHKENGGYGIALNIGIANASGEYIGIVESDDFVKDTMFEDLYKLAKENNLDMIKSDFYYYLSAKNQARQAGKFKKKYVGKVINIKDYPEILKIQASIWSAIYKKSFLEENNIGFLETPGASYQDTSFSFKTLISAKRLMLTDKAYLYYRQDNEGSSVHNKNKVYNIYTEWEKITHYLNESPEIKEVINQVKLCVQYYAYRWNTIRVDNEYKPEFVDKFSQTFKKYYDDGEIQKDFYKKVDKKEFNLLLNDKEKYLNYMDRIAQKKANKEKRRKMFSIRINSSRVSIILFGKQII